nr:uncharacterized protein LOC111108350 isoform X2 [Crassostrea virginica]
MLNVLDCTLVLGGLFLDIHFIKEMLQKTKILTVSFASILTNNFAVYFGDLGDQDIDVFYNRILSVMYRSVSAADGRGDVVPNATAPNFTLMAPFSRDNVPRFLLDDTNVPDLEVKIAIALHKISITILAILTLMVLMKIFCYGTRIFSKKIELLDGLIVISSFVVDLVYMKGLLVYPLQEAVQILAFLVPWRVIRVANSFVIAVMDRAHLKLKMEYKQKKKIQRKLEFAMEKNKYYKNVIHKIRNLCLKENIPQTRISDCVLSIDPPQHRKTATKFKKWKKSFQFQCIRGNGNGKCSVVSFYGENGEHDLQQSNNLDPDNKPTLKSALSSRTWTSQTHNDPHLHNHHQSPQGMLSTPSHQSVYFHLGSDVSDDSSDEDEDDVGLRLVDFSDVDGLQIKTNQTTNS